MAGQDSHRAQQELPPGRAGQNLNMAHRGQPGLQPLDSHRGEEREAQQQALSREAHTQDNAAPRGHSLVGRREICSNLIFLEGSL
jgi:hypothetical protein